MPLLSRPLLVTLAALLVAATAAILVLWSRVHGAPVLRVVQRLGLLLTVQALSVALMAAAVNDYGYFYGSWHDLFGGSGSAAVSHVGRAATVSVAVTAGLSATGRWTATSWSTPAQYPVRGRLVSTTIHGERSGLSAPAVIYLPPQYYQRADARMSFPAAEVLGGYPGSLPGLVHRMNWPGAALARVEAGTANPMVLVMVEPTVAPPRDTECTDVPRGPRVETFLAADVPAAVGARVRVNPVGWGAFGDSTGGYCATKLAMDHPDVFTAAVSLSGYYHTVKDSTTGDLWGGSATYRDLNDPEWVLRHLPAPPVCVLATIGSLERGPLGIRDTNRFVAEVHTPMSADLVVVRGGGHNYADWMPLMPRAIDWMSAHLPPPSLTPAQP